MATTYNNLFLDVRKRLREAGVEAAQLEARELGNVLSQWLARQPKKNRVAFVRRYWYADSLADTAARIGCSTAAAKSLLHRMRESLRDYLEKEGAWT